MKRSVLKMSAILLVASVVASGACGKEAKKPTGKTVANDPNKLICRKYPVTGSLVATTKVCHTRAEWSHLSDQARRDTEQLQDPKNGTVSQ
jgi:hypothetical protein